MKTTAIDKLLKRCNEMDITEQLNWLGDAVMPYEARAELEAMKAERLAIATSIKCTVNGEAPDNLAECVSYLMLQEYYPAQNTIHQKYLEIKGLKAQLAAKDELLHHAHGFLSV